MDTRDVAATRETYEAVAAEYAERHDDRADVAPFLAKFRAACTGDRVVDAGCGPGYDAALLGEWGFDVLGLDLSAEFLDVAADTAPWADLARMDMRELGIADGAAGGLWACASFIHVPRHQAEDTLREFARVLRSGAPLFLGVLRGPGERSPSAYEEDERRVTLYERAEIVERLDRSGFDVDETVGDGMWLDVHASCR
ncbi:MAG: class I SAM-dependent methyltransferase [Halobacteriaceae archaeon]